MLLLLLNGASGVTKISSLKGFKLILKIRKGIETLWSRSIPKHTLSFSISISFLESVFNTSSYWANWTWWLLLHLMWFIILVLLFYLLTHSCLVIMALSFSLLVWYNLNIVTWIEHTAYPHLFSSGGQKSRTRVGSWPHPSLDSTPVSAHWEYIQIKCNWKTQLFNGSN